MFLSSRQRLEKKPLLLNQSEIHPSLMIMGFFFSINCYGDRGTINYTVFLKKNIVEDVYFAAVHFLLLSIFHIMLLVASASFLRCLIS